MTTKFRQFTEIVIALRNLLEGYIRKLIEWRLAKLEAKRASLRESINKSTFRLQAPTYHFVIAKRGMREVGLRINAGLKPLPEEGTYAYLAKEFDLAYCSDPKNPQSIPSVDLMRIEQRWIRVRIQDGIYFVI